MSTTPTEILETAAAAVESTLAADPTAGTEAALDLDSIKELMDNFDPAALLPELDSVFGVVELVCRIAVMAGPIVLLVLGLAYLFLSPKEANYYFGYRTYYGMGSVPAWRFTQRLAGIVLGGLGLVLTVVMLFVSMGFRSMEVNDMVWRAVTCLIWEAALALAGTLLINLTAMMKFDAKGSLRAKNAR